MIRIGYRHGLRASELCDLQWSQVELTTGRLHVRRAKNGLSLRVADRDLAEV
jgi:integrase